MSDRNEHRVPSPSRPAECSDEEYERRLWRDTDASLRRDPERWVVASATDGGDAARVSGVRAYLRDGDRSTSRSSSGRSSAGRRSWETRRAREAAATPAADDDRWDV